MTTDLTDVWLTDSVCGSLEDMADYIVRNEWKLKRVAGPNGDFDVYHYAPNNGQSLAERGLTDEEMERLDSILKMKLRKSRKI